MHKAKFSHRVYSISPVLSYHSSLTYQRILNSSPSELHQYNYSPTTTGSIENLMPLIIDHFDGNYPISESYIEIHRLVRF